MALNLKYNVTYQFLKIIVFRALSYIRKGNLKTTLEPNNIEQQKTEEMKNEKELKGWKDLSEVGDYNLKGSQVHGIKKFYMESWCNHFKKYKVVQMYFLALDCLNCGRIVVRKKDNIIDKFHLCGDCNRNTKKEDNIQQQWVNNDIITTNKYLSDDISNIKTRPKNWRELVEKVEVIKKPKKVKNKEKVEVEFIPVTEERKKEIYNEIDNKFNKLVNEIKEYNLKDYTEIYDHFKKIK